MQPNLYNVVRIEADLTLTFLAIEDHQARKNPSVLELHVNELVTHSRLR